MAAQASAGHDCHMTEPPNLRVRRASPSDAAAVVAIYNEGIAERRATFETEARRPRDVIGHLASSSHPALVAEDGDEVVGWAWIAPYSEREVYAGVADCSVYVRAAARGRGVGTRLTQDLASEAKRLGFHKLLGKLLTTNEASVRLVRRCGFREVGVHRAHGRLDGEWRDVVLVELLLGEAARSALVPRCGVPQPP
jgi:L-amino acid N-acyltransferase YncA